MKARKASPEDLKALRIYPVILSGGYGARLWPASSPAKPKQFLRLTGDRSLFQETVIRTGLLQGAAPPLVIAGRDHIAWVEAQTKALGVAATVLIEPEGRDSGPALAAAALWVRSQDPEALILMVASDHHIADGAAFVRAVAEAAPAAEAGRIVTFGVQPKEPSTAYGYIEKGAPTEVAGVFSVARFVEKPDAKTAQAYIEAGLVWNSGNFLFRPDTLLSELDAHAPDMVGPVAEALDGAFKEDRRVWLSAAFGQAPRLSVDYAVMEKTAKAAVKPVDYDWSDLGAWEAIWRAALKTDGGNAISGAPRVTDCQDSLIDAGSGVPVVALGLKSIAVVARPDGILVCDLASSQAIKTAIAGLPDAAARPLPRTALEAVAGLKQWLFTSALPLWWALGADHLRGGFHEALTQEGAPVETPARVRVQTRQIYTFAAAGRLGWRGPWRQAVDHGLAGLFARYRLGDGLYRGAEGDAVAPSYEQAFAMLALASAARVLPDRRAELLGAIEALADALTPRLDAFGGVAEVVDEPYQSNPNMHLFEAAMAWEDAGGGARARTLAAGLAKLALDHLIDGDSGMLCEFFDARWTPIPAEDGSAWEPGHQFEWAWLLSRWALRSGDKAAATAAERLFAVGLKGVDPIRGAAANMIHAPSEASGAVARLWPQSERLKAAACFAHLATDEETRQAWLRETAAASKTLDRYIDTAIPGLWWDRLTPDDVFIDEPARATSLYHLMAAVEGLASLMTDADQ